MSHEKSKKKGFTLIELIVVITIIAILGTIAFISFTGYSQSSRDSKRIADINSVQKSLELYITTKGTYPIPDNNVNITYSGSTAWIEGTVGDNVIINIENINKKPLDPLTGNEYTYSVTSTKTEYQIGAISESGQIGYKLPINQIYASDTKNATAMVRGNYNEKFLRVQSGSLNWILAIPSIITTDLVETELQVILDDKMLVYNNYSNIPHSYKNKGFKMKGGFEFTKGNPLIYSGSLNSLLEDENKIKFVNNLKEVYKGTILESNEKYFDLINTDTSVNQTKAVNLVNNLINTKVGGIGMADVQNIAMAEIKCGKEYKIVDGNCVENNKEGEICLGLPANAVWNSTETITQSWNGSEWLPTKTGVYNTESSTVECRYKCATNYAWNGSSCVLDACSGSIPNYAESNATSQGYGTNWTYNTSAGKCTYICSSGYNRTSGSCQLPKLVNNIHTQAQCTSAGGSVQGSGTSAFCRFNSSSCPSGWTNYLSRSTTTSKTCGSGTNCSKCTVTGTSWRNSYPYCEYCTTGANWATVRVRCYATKTQVGCY